MSTTRTIEHEGKTYTVTARPSAFDPSTTIFRAYAEIPSMFGAAYSTLTTLNGRPHGQLGSEHSDYRYASLPRLSRERERAYREVAAENRKRAHNVIEAAFPGIDFRPGAASADLFVAECELVAATAKVAL
jgi:hypothetical protein